MTEKRAAPGVFWSPERTRFTVFSANATRVELDLFERPDSAARSARFELDRRDAGIWSTEVAGLRPGQLYGYRAEGEWAPQSGKRYNPAKLLVDPMARAITGEPREHRSLFGFNPGERPELGYNGEDGAAFMPKCVVVDPAFDWGDDRPPRTSWSDTVIYECHIRGMTARHPEVADELRGTFLGLVEPPVLDHLKRLGITAVELMPVQQIASEPRLLRRGLRNYWGYSPLGFCAPNAGYATGYLGDQVTEFKTMVRELHRAGLEVILDVVYNHTAEGDITGPMLSLKGLDNRAYYRLQRSRMHYVNYTGCGNTLDFGQPVVRQMILDSLRYWVREMHVDGFRFDLATVLGRGGSPTGSLDPFSSEAPLFEAIAEDLDLSEVKLIAEPWDVGPDGYQLGNFPSGWAEWNDRYRDAVRSFWRGDRGAAAELATRIAGSRDLFADKGPLRSIHFVTSHDGFTLSDLVSYDHKHNEANQEDNRDGHDNNLSRNWGVEGPTDDPAVSANRDRARRNLIATLALSPGVPMLLHGDELGRSQQGNNNAYCQDSELSWVDWSEPDQSFLDFLRRALEIRRSYPGLRREGFLGSRDLQWWHPDGRELTSEDWQNPDVQAIGIWLPGAAAEDAGSTGADEALLLLLNGGPSTVAFQLSPGGSDPPWNAYRWTEILDTARGPAGPLGQAPSPVALGQFSMRAFALRSG